jgi:hypothetical protein
MQFGDTADWKSALQGELDAALGVSGRCRQGLRGTKFAKQSAKSVENENEL